MPKCLTWRFMGIAIGRAISPLIWVISIVILLITPLIATHEPPSGSGRIPKP